MTILQVERIGGVAGFGGALAHIRSRGEIDIATLSSSDRNAIERLFAPLGERQPSHVRDTFRYRISRASDQGVDTIEAPEELVPAVIRECVKDEFV